MKLVIVESPNKCATIQKYLGDKYDVISTVGHFRKLNKGNRKTSDPKARYGFDLETLEVMWDIEKTKSWIKNFRNKINKANFIYIATDPDREGEAIGWHLKDYFNIPEDKYNRIIFNAVRKENIEQAIAHPAKLNLNLFNAYLVRRLLDRMIGWDLSDFIQNKLRLKKYIDTTGRVQSVALWFVAKREEEIQAFKSQEFYTIDAKLKFNDLEYKVKYPSAKPEDLMMQEREAKEFVKLMPQEMTVVAKKVKETKGKPLLAFTTASLYRACYNLFAMTPKWVSSTAQYLFQKGYISYHRTDSVRIEKPLEDKIAHFVKTKYGEKYISQYKGSNKKVDQDAHEAITALNLDLNPEEFNKKESRVDLQRVYALIYNRTLGCVMKPPIFEKTTIELEAATLKFAIKGSRIVFDGFIKATGQNPNDIILPEINIGDKFNIETIEAIKNETKPPARYNAASLIKKLEEKKVGRPSTYSKMIEDVTTDKKQYTKVENKRIIATEKGLEVSKLLSYNFKKIISPSYTSQLEKSLDDIANFKTNYKTWWKEFINNFYTTLEIANKNTKQKELKRTGEICPSCKAPLVLYPSRIAHKYIICENRVKNHKSCSFFKTEWPLSDQLCPKHDKPFLIKKSKRGTEFLSCQNWPECKETKRMDGFNPTKTGQYCTEKDCDGEIMNQKNKKTGELFESCNNWFKHKKNKKFGKKS